MLTLSHKNGISGSIKQAPEDFVVREIARNGTVLELDRKYDPAELGEAVSADGKFVVFVLQKRDWNTIQALKMFAKKFRRGIKSAGFAGTKDRKSVSTQLCSIYGAKAEEVAAAHMKDISVNGAWQSDHGMEMGDLMGNRFTITVNGQGDHEAIAGIADELGGVFPNYFGEQRFGVRNNNVDIGLSILKGDLQSAAMTFLTDTRNEASEDAVEARKRLAEEQDFAKAIGYFPRYLRYELMMIGALAKNPTDFGGAIRRLPRALSLMFVHSVDSHIFNMEVERRVKEGSAWPEKGDLVCPKNEFGFPDTEKTAAFDVLNDPGFAVGNMVGYNSEPNDAENAILAELGLEKEMFKVKSMPELNCKGARRVLFAPFVGFSDSVSDGEVKVEFSLPAGSYATVLMKEFMK